MTKYDTPSDPYIDKIKKALLIAYIGNVGCTLSNEDCNDLTKYISRLEGNIAAYEVDRLETEHRHRVEVE